MKKLTMGAMGVLPLIAGALLAHHSWGGFYDLRQQVILKGKVSKVDFKEPHVVLTIETQGSGSWLAEFTNVADLKRNGIIEDTLKVGDFLEIVRSPARDPGKNIVAAYWEVRRPADGFRWSWQEWPGPRVIE